MTWRAPDPSHNKYRLHILQSIQIDRIETPCGRVERLLQCSCCVHVAFWGHGGPAALAMKDGRLFAVVRPRAAIPLTATLGHRRPRGPMTALGTFLKCELVQLESALDPKAEMPSLRISGRETRAQRQGRQEEASAKKSKAPMPVLARSDMQLTRSVHLGDCPVLATPFIFRASARASPRDPRR
jgi:hypothetical protein